MINVFHATNYKAAKDIKAVGHIGFDRNDYDNLAIKIAKFFDIHPHNLMKIMDDFVSSETNGGVSFFQSFEKCKIIAKTYAKSNGEFKGIIINRMLKKASRIKKIKFNKDIIDSILNLKPIDYTPVILEFRIPETLIVNKDKIGTSLELYTNEPVSTKYLVTITKVR